MNFKQVFVGAFFAAGVSMASAMTTIEYDAYVLEYNEDTVFGAPTLSFNGGGGYTGFGWQLPSEINSISTGGNANGIQYSIPSFTITAKPGWTLSGPLGSFFGNVVFNEVDGGNGNFADTSMSATAFLSVNGGDYMPVGGSITKVLTLDGGNVRSGYFADSGQVSFGSFESLEVTGGVISLSASGGIYASIISQPQNTLEFSFTAAPVPEPESWALLMAGLGLIGYAARRRSAARS